MRANKDKNGITIVGIPEQWYRLATPDNLTLNYKEGLPLSEHIIDGWDLIEDPVFDEAIEELGELVHYPNESLWRYNIIALDQAEIDARKNNLQEEIAEDSFFNSVNDGRELFKKARKRMSRRFKDDNVAPNNVLLLDDVQKFMRWNRACYTSLEQGDFYGAEFEVLKTLIENVVELDANRALQKMFEWLRDQIQAYILNDYDLK